MAAVLPPALEAMMRQAQGQKIQEALWGYLPQDVPGYNRAAAIEHGGVIADSAPGYAAHADDLARSADFVNKVIAGGMSPNGPVGMPQRIMDELANRYPDKAYPVGTTVTGGGNMDYMPRGPMRDGSLNALTTMLSGLGAPMGYQAPVEPEPRTMVIRPTSRAGGAGNHAGTIVPNSQLEALLKGFDNWSDGGIDPMAFRQPDSRGIVDQDKNDAYRQGLASQQATARDLITQRAMQEANARSYRRSGMDPRTAALLAAMGGDSELGQMAAYNAIGGPQAYDRAMDRRMAGELGRADTAASIEREKIRAGQPGTAAGQGAAAVDPREAHARGVFDTARARGSTPANAANDAYHALIAQDVPAKDAVAIVERATGEHPTAADKPTPKRSAPRTKKEVQEGRVNPYPYGLPDPGFYVEP